MQIYMELPGVPKESIELETLNGVLSVKGIKQPDYRTGDTSHRQERIAGNFARSFRVPEDSDPAAITASMTDGVLRITFASSTAKPKATDYDTTTHNLFVTGTSTMYLAHSLASLLPELVLAHGVRAADVESLCCASWSLRRSLMTSPSALSSSSSSSSSSVSTAPKAPTSLSSDPFSDDFDEGENQADDAVMGQVGGSWAEKSSRAASAASSAVSGAFDNSTGCVRLGRADDEDYDVWLVLYAMRWGLLGFAESGCLGESSRPSILEAKNHFTTFFSGSASSSSLQWFGIGSPRAWLVKYYTSDRSLSNRLHLVSSPAFLTCSGWEFRTSGRGALMFVPEAESSLTLHLIISVLDSIAIEFSQSGTSIKYADKLLGSTHSRQSPLASIWYHTRGDNNSKWVWVRVKKGYISVGRSLRLGDMSFLQVRTSRADGVQAVGFSSSYASLSGLHFYPSAGGIESFKSTVLGLSSQGNLDALYCPGIISPMWELQQSKCVAFSAGTFMYPWSRVIICLVRAPAVSINAIKCVLRRTSISILQNGAELLPEEMFECGHTLKFRLEFDPATSRIRWNCCPGDRYTGPATTKGEIRVPEIVVPHGHSFYVSILPLGVIVSGTKIQRGIGH
ncbi:hypothetical protein Pelo_15732 [Pelomyxa schiedti]|nr:hypothetical protein Pelo_15732 [Pelomyxa schiedti]